MASPQMLRANHADLFGSTALPVLEEIFRNELALHPAIREQLFQMKKTDRDIWQASEITDLANFSEVAEGADYTLTKTQEGNNRTLVVKKYGLGFSISEEAVEDGKFDFIADCVRKLAESAIDTRETSAMAILNNAFTSQTAWDSVALCSTSHVTPVSALTFRNKPSTDADLSSSSLDAALSDFETQFVRDSGKKAMIKPKVLLVHPSQRRYAMELIGSDLKADSSDNNMNSLKQEGLRVISSPRLTDSDAWFLLADPRDTGLVIVERKGIETKAAGPDVGFMNDSITYKSRYREIVGVTHAYGVYGSTGA